MKQNNKAQEEMVGFAVLIIIVAVVGVLFLSFMLGRHSSTEISSLSVQQFSEALVHATSECNLGAWPKLSSFSDVIDACYNAPSALCDNGISACQYLNSSIIEITNTAWPISPDSPFVEASFSLLFKDRISKEEKEFSSLQFKNCSGSSMGGESIIPDSRKKGNFILRISICLNNR